MIEGAVLDLLAFYRRELCEGPEGREALEKLGVSEPEVAEHFSLGYASGRAMRAASEAQYGELKRLGLAYKRRERLHGCVVAPVFDRAGGLVDMIGLRPYPSGVRYLNWRSPARGLLGADKLGGDGELLLCDAPLWALQARELRACRVCALRASKDGGRELERHLPLLRESGVRRAFLLTRQQMGKLAPVLAGAGVEVVPLQMHSSATAVTAGLLGPMDGPREGEVRVRLVSRRGTRLSFKSGETEYTVDAGALTGLSMRAQVRAVRGGASIIDRLDLASASARGKFARVCAARFAVSSSTFEDEICAIAGELDGLEAEEAAGALSLKRDPTPAERAAGERILRGERLLELLSGALERHFGVIGEEANRRLAVLVTASRLLPRPLGAIVRGPAGCGKSALVGAAARLLPQGEVLYFSRLTAQSLYFMPAEQLQHKLLVVDEYEGLLDAEYALRTLMSSGALSLAITLREGGKVPVTRTVEMEAALAVLVSTTRPVNIENLSRFLELRMDDSAAQTRTVMEGLAARVKGQPGAGEDLEGLRGALGLLAPCRVRVPFADRLVYSSGNVLARRQYGKIIGLVSAHAALHQRQRNCAGGDGLQVQAEPADYAAVYPLLGHVLESFEEEVSPAALEILDHLEGGGRPVFTRKEAMAMCGWSYSKVYRTLRELEMLDLVIPARAGNGVEGTFELAPYHRGEAGVSHLPPPEDL